MDTQITTRSIAALVMMGGIITAAFGAMMKTTMELLLSLRISEEGQLRSNINAHSTRYSYRKGQVHAK